MWEDDFFPKLSPDRQAQIEVVSSAYQSIVADLAYLTMPVTAGKRLYELMEKYGVRTKEELEKKCPGALWEEVVLPNIENGRTLAHKLHTDKGSNFLVPGIFDARKLGWSQREYMVLWLKFISASAKEIYLVPGWEYSSGGAMEFVRGMMLQFRFAARKEPITIKDEQARIVDLSGGALTIAYAIRDLRKRGFDDKRLSQEFRHLASLAFTLAKLAEEKPDVWERHVWGTPSFSCSWILSAAHSLGIKPVRMAY